jgi:predicted nuclease of predicted toxin-antitoxin system
VKFLIDMPLSPTLAAWLTNQRHDGVRGVDLGLHRAADTEINPRAKLDAHTVVTADLDYPRLLALAQATEPSLILFSRGDWSEADVIARLSDLHAGLSEADIAQSILVVDRDRMRLGRLSIA